MKITDFKIGSKFFGPAHFEWLCTDIGTRTITAIFLDPDKPSYYFQGPPYSVPEKVFDDLEMTSCYSDFEEELTSRVSSLNSLTNCVFLLIFLRFLFWRRRRRLWIRNSRLGVSFGWRRCQLFIL